MVLIKKANGASVLKDIPGFLGLEFEFSPRETDVVEYMKTHGTREQRVIEIAESLFPNQSKDVFLYSTLSRIHGVKLVNRREDFVEIKGHKIKQVFWSATEEVINLEIKQE